MRLSIYPLGLGNARAFNVLIDRMAKVNPIRSRRSGVHTYEVRSFSRSSASQPTPHVLDLDLSCERIEPLFQLMLCRFDLQARIQALHHRRPLRISVWYRQLLPIPALANPSVPSAASNFGLDFSCQPQEASMNVSRNESKR